MFIGEEYIDLLKVNFLLMNEFNFNLTELENMVPFEREIYIFLLMDHIEKKKKMLNNTGTT